MHTSFLSLASGPPGEVRDRGKEFLRRDQLREVDLVTSQHGAGPILGAGKAVSAIAGVRAISSERARISRIIFKPFF